MGRSNRHGSLRKKINKVPAKKFEPNIFIDHGGDFASIKIAPGVEAKSYIKDGFVFCEDRAGNIIEIQVLNLSELAKKKDTAA